MKVEYGNVAEDAVWAGVDTHAATNWLSVVDARGSELFSGEFATDPEGYRKLCDECIQSSPNRQNDLSKIDTPPTRIG